MGCCASSEDTGMNTGWKDRQATGAGADVLTDADIAALATDLNAGLSQTMMLNFEGSDLPNLDSGSKTDAFAVLFDVTNGKKTRVGNTEVIFDSLNPKWINVIEVTFKFEED